MNIYIEYMSRVYVHSLSTLICRVGFFGQSKANARYSLLFNGYSLLVTCYFNFFVTVILLQLLGHVVVATFTYLNSNHLTYSLISFIFWC